MLKLKLRLKWLEAKITLLSIWLMILTIAVWIVCKILEAFPGTVLTEGIKAVLRGVMTDQFTQEERWADKARREARQIANEMNEMNKISPRK